jgi:hypothetical protein
MLELLGLVFGNIFSGGATGLIGMIAQRFADYKNKQLDIEIERDRHKNAVEMRRVDAEIMKQEWAAKTKVAEVEAAGKEAVADAEAFAASYKLEPERYSDGVKPSRGQAWVLVLLDAFRGCIRPLLTVYLCALTTFVWWQAKTVLNAEDLDTAAALEVWKMVVGNIIYLTTTCVVWWFGVRNKNSGPTIGKTS